MARGGETLVPRAQTIRKVLFWPNLLFTEPSVRAFFPVRGERPGLAP